MIIQISIIVLVIVGAGLYWFISRRNRNNLPAVSEDKNLPAVSEDINPPVVSENQNLPVAPEQESSDSVPPQNPQ
jgi:lipopolysaccharide export system protein LptC